MKKLLNLMMALTMAVLATGLASCSKDDDGPDGGSNGSMTGWIKIDDKKYDLKYCWDLPDDDTEDNHWTIATASKDIDYNVMPKDNYDFGAINVLQNTDGSWMVDVFFVTDLNPREDYTEYYSYEGSDVTVEKNGDYFLIKADNVTFVKYDITYGHGDEKVLGRYNGSFYFSGKPGTFKNTHWE